MTVVNVSPHLLADVLTCETKAWTRHVRGYTSKSDAIKAKAGQGFHAGVAAYLDPKLKQEHGPSTVTALALRKFHDVYDSAWETLDASQLAPELTPGNLHKLVARWCEMHPDAILPWRRVLMVEEAFESRRWLVPVADGIPPIVVRLIVRPDALVEDKHGFLRFLDTKTTGWRISADNWKAELRLSTQIGLYTDALQSIAPRFGLPALLGGWINAVELRKLPDDPKRKCSSHPGSIYAVCGPEHAKQEVQEVLTTQSLVTAAVRDAEWAARRFVEMLAIEDPTQLDMRGRANRACGFCAAQQWCENAERNPAVLGNFMQYEPWMIEEGVRE